jgi:hypothetical protein
MEDGTVGTAGAGGRDPRTRTPPGRARTIVAVATVAVLVLVAGTVLAVTTIHSGAFSGSGVDDTGSPLTWWAQVSTGTATVPTPAPALASLNAVDPTILGATSTAYGLNAQTSGQESVAWAFGERAGAPPSTEVEIVFELSVGGAPSGFTVFVETQSISPTSTLTFTFYIDAGTHPVVLSSWLQISEVCGSVGACP